MTPLRAILLTAVSSPQQATSDKESLEMQERDLRALAAREGWDVIDVLRIPGHSRRYFNYHEFAEDMRAAGFDAADKMFAHWRARDFDVLAVWMGDRLSREQSMFAEIIARTIDARATIYDLKSGGWIKEDNYRMYAAMSGYAAASAIDALVTRGRRAQQQGARPRAGRPTGANARKLLDAGAAGDQPTPARHHRRHALRRAGQQARRFRAKEACVTVV